MTYFLVFQALNAVLLALDARGFQRVRPVLNTAFGALVQCLPVLISHGDVGLNVGFGNLVLDALELVESDHDAAALADGLAVGWGRHACGPGRRRLLTLGHALRLLRHIF